MKKFNNLTYADKIIWRIRILWVLIAAMLIYMVTIGEMGLGDSRIMTDFATIFSRITFFGGMIYVAYRISYNKKLLKNRQLLKEQLREEEDERNQYLHDKSGGIVMDIFLFCLLPIAMTASLCHMVAFYTSVIILGIAIVLKAAAYYYYSHS